MLLEVVNICRSFDGVRALDGADLAVAEGSITGLIGPNGAGKTTLFNVVSGMIRPDSGQVRLAGRDITGWTPDRIARAGLVRSFQIARGFPRLTVLENLMVYAPGQPGEGVLAALLGRGRDVEAEVARRARALAERLNLTRVLDSPAIELSGGQKKLLELGRVLMAEPRLVLLDEPAAGVNPTLAGELAEHVRALAREGVTFLVIEHDMGLVERLCDPVVVMAEGRRLTAGAFAAVRADRQVQEAYLGRRAWAS